MIITITEFNTEAFESFKDQINLLEKDDSVKIYLDSSGGSVINKDMYKDVIDSLANVELIGLTIFSSAFTLFKEANCKKKLLDSSYGMVHMETWETAIGEGGLPRGDIEKFKFKNRQESEIRDISFLTDAEKELYKDGRDVFLSRGRLKEIFSM